MKMAQGGQAPPTETPPGHASMPQARQRGGSPAEPGYAEAGR